LISIEIHANILTLKADERTTIRTNMHNELIIGFMDSTFVRVQ